MDLSPVRLLRPHPRNEPMVNIFPGVGVAFDAMVFNEGDVLLERFTERVLAVTRNR